MTKRYFENIVARFGIWRTVQAALTGVSVILLTTAVSQLFFPVYSWQTDGQAESAFESAAGENISALLDGTKGRTEEPIAYRPGMFKPATGLQDRPLADRTIERIKEQLQLQCVLEMNGRPAAYINIQGVGLKKCCVGENINDLFTVLDINGQAKTVDISIVEHRITLHL
jgi:hypothetical protein